MKVSILFFFVLFFFMHNQTQKNCRMKVYPGQNLLDTQYMYFFSTLVNVLYCTKFMCIGPEYTAKTRSVKSFTSKSDLLEIQTGPGSHVPSGMITLSLSLFTMIFLQRHCISYGLVCLSFPRQGY